MEVDGSPVWSRDGMIAVANAHKDKVKVTFSRGASLADPDKLFNAGLEGKTWRAIDFFEGDKVNEPALKNLVRAAIDHNQAKSRRKRRRVPERKHPRKNGMKASSRKLPPMPVLRFAGPDNPLARASAAS